jgi:hypothetical protein
MSDELLATYEEAIRVLREIMLNSKIEAHRIRAAAVLAQVLRPQGSLTPSAAKRRVEDVIKRLEEEGALHEVASGPGKGYFTAT